MGSVEAYKTAQRGAEGKLHSESSRVVIARLPRRSLPRERSTQEAAAGSEGSGESHPRRIFGSRIGCDMGATDLANDQGAAERRINPSCSAAKRVFKDRRCQS